MINLTLREGKNKNKMQLNLQILSARNVKMYLLLQALKLPI